MTRHTMSSPDRVHWCPVVGGVSTAKQHADSGERPISDAYREIDNDLARDNMENDLPDADLQDL